tara:strand:+ start:23 stop:217 length:195 start_codon:yes stop_codon:yes gene_type:complete
MSNTPENCEKVANYIVGSMTLDELQQFAYDDIYSIMLEDNDIYEVNREVYGEIVQTLDKELENE